MSKIRNFAEISQAAEAHEGPDEEDNPPPAGPVGQDTEGDA